jgi:hypothetical protein
VPQKIEFVCAADESADSGNFFYGGFAAPAMDWDGCFSAAWRERVLDGPPSIPYLHMTDIRDWNWQTKYSLTPWQAESRVAAAAEVIRSTGSLIPVIFWANRKEYDSILRQPFNPGRGRKKAPLDPDYICFAWFALTQLQWLHERYGSDIGKVHFWVERNRPTTARMSGFHHSLLGAVDYIKRPYLAPLIGDFLEVSKQTIATQAADALAWHARNNRRGTLDTVGVGRYWRMTESGFGTLKGRYGHRGGMTEGDMRKLAAAFAKYPGTLQQPPDAE